MINSEFENLNKRTIGKRSLIGVSIESDPARERISLIFLNPSDLTLFARISKIVKRIRVRVHEKIEG